MKKPLLSVSKIAGPAFAALTLLMTSCAGPRYVAVNHREYERMPHCFSSKFWETVASTPLTKNAAFHGNWGGSGNKGGPPTDELDELFRRHDIVYHECRHPDHLKAADRALVKRLEALDESTLDPKARAFRKRAIKFMNSRLAEVVGKPISVVFRDEERPECYFTSVEVVEAFFDPSHSGLPYPETLKSDPIIPETDPGHLMAATPEPAIVDSATTVAAVGH